MNCSKCGKAILSAPGRMCGACEGEAKADAGRVRWISVDERLPKRDERILVYRPCSERSDTGPVSVQWGWICNKKIPEASYWMPLPEPPKEG